MVTNLTSFLPLLYILAPIGAFFAAFGFAKASYKNGLTTAQEQLTQTYKELLDVEEKKMTRMTHQNIALKDELHRLRRKVKYDLDHHHQDVLIAKEMQNLSVSEQDL